MFCSYSIETIACKKLEDIISRNTLVHSVGIRELKCSLPFCMKLSCLTFSTQANPVLHYHCSFPMPVTTYMLCPRQADFPVNDWAFPAHFWTPSLLPV